MLRYTIDLCIFEDQSSPVSSSYSSCLVAPQRASRGHARQRLWLAGQRPMGRRRGRRRAGRPRLWRHPSRHCHPPALGTSLGEGSSAVGGSAPTLPRACGSRPPPPPLTQCGCDVDGLAAAPALARLGPHPVAAVEPAPARTTPTRVLPPVPRFRHAVCLAVTRRVSNPSGSPFPPPPTSLANAFAPLSLDPPPARALPSPLLLPPFPARPSVPLLSPPSSAPLSPLHPPHPLRPSD